MTVDTDLPQLPFRRSGLLEIAPEYARLRERAPLVRVRTEAGDLAWLATRYHTVRQLFADERLGRSHPDPSSAPRVSGSLLFGGPTGDFDTEPELNRLHREVLAPAFSARRARLVAGHVRALATGMIDRLAQRQPPVDLHEHLSFPLPVIAICELLGVPVAERDLFRLWSARFAGLVDPADAAGAVMAMQHHMRELVGEKRSHPGDDLVSDLIAAAEGHPLLTDDEIADIAVHLLLGGHENTVARIDHGTLLLLRHPEQREALRRHPALVEAAVEEILRVSVPVEDHFPRWARADIEVGEVTIRAGEAVLLSPSVANMDESVYPEPERFDIFRTPAPPQTGSGQGFAPTVGAALARMELRAIFSLLFQRLPGLRTAVPLAELRGEEERGTGGLKWLPVTW
ncbi:cytochrome P450 [Streptomyces sp. DSM 44917]|uniref:Cytochrome P450 n=1 Tax=Streptomyces boetiae TaxID=3075541 RepID=A0ABU2L504_9ACTN|nr:cytochrome P450 [Streptomyces sp. DSM 44917]MDT0306457.1 cytochrome P450 [Streptomyces sp. DSM 44917]